MSSPRSPSSAEGPEDLKYLDQVFGQVDPDLTKGSNQKLVMAAALNANIPYSVVKVELPRNADGDSAFQESRPPVQGPGSKTSESSVRSPPESVASVKERYQGLKHGHSKAPGSPTSTRRSESPRFQQSDYGTIHESRESLNIPSWMYDPALGGFNPLPTRGALHKHRKKEINTDSGKRNTTAKAVLQMRQAMDMIQNENNFSRRGAIAGWKLSPIKSYHQNRAYGIWSQARSEVSSAPVPATPHRPATQQSSHPPPSRQATQRSLSTEPLEHAAKEPFQSPSTDALSRRVFGTAVPTSPFHNPHMTLSGGHDSLSSITSHSPLPRTRSARALGPLGRPRTEGVPARQPPSLNSTLHSQASSRSIDGVEPWPQRLPGSAPVASLAPTELSLSGGHGRSLPLPLHDYRDQPYPSPSPSPSPFLAVAPFVDAHSTSLLAPSESEEPYQEPHQEPYLQYLRRRATQKWGTGRALQAVQSSHDALGDSDRG